MSFLTVCKGIGLHKTDLLLISGIGIQTTTSQIAPFGQKPRGSKEVQSSINIGLDNGILK